MSLIVPTVFESPPSNETQTSCVAPGATVTLGATVQLETAVPVHVGVKVVALIEVVGAGPVAVDTALFIYLIEEHPRFLEAVRPLFAEADTGRRRLVTSAVTLLEVLLVPYRAGDRALAARYEALLSNSRGLTLVDIDRTQLRAAAQLRAAHGLCTPDALQIAAAVTAGCAVIVTNDRAMRSVPGLEVIQLTRHV